MMENHVESLYASIGGTLKSFLVTPQSCDVEWHMSQALQKS